MLELVDDALMSVTEAKKKADKKKADEAFENAVNGLSDYERKYHLKPDTETVAERIKKAEEMDKASSKVLNSLMEKFRVREEPIILLHHTFKLILSRWNRNRHFQSSFLSTIPLQI